MPKHLNHIAENIVFKKRNISFLAINYLFRIKNYKIFESKEQFKDSFIITGFVPVQKNDKLINKSEHLTVIFRINKYNNIIVITAYSETDGN
ncbi:MAG: hypothetical protein U9N85_01650 [Bacteroidota bacterium]|nr:hypothetical protein [Bacteroidota bacterium]